MAQDRRWVQRLIDEERAPAVWMTIVAVATMGWANIVGAHTVHAVQRFGASVMPLEAVVSEGLLVVFFFVAGLELRHELTHGSLNTLRAAALPVIAAALGMLTPALIFVATAPAGASAAWGVPMATDLPLALALLAIAGRGLPTEFRAFLLSLAIVDDALSILVVAAVFGSALSLPWLGATALLVLAYMVAERRSGWVSGPIAVLAWLAMLRTGIHPTVLGVVLGLVTTRSTDAIRERWQPFSAYIAVPAFVAVSLAIPVGAEDVNGPLIGSLVAARVVGKPLGIWLGASVAKALLRPRGAMPGRMYAAAGSVAGLGFSVSLLFADLSLDDPLLAQTKLAVILALLAAAVVGSLAIRPLRREARGR